jgi:hypothetical protein
MEEGCPALGRRDGERCLRGSSSGVEGGVPAAVATWEWRGCPDGGGGAKWREGQLSRQLSRQGTEESRPSGGDDDVEWREGTRDDA